MEKFCSCFCFSCAECVSSVRSSVHLPVPAVLLPYRLLSCCLTCAEKNAIILFKIDGEAILHEIYDVIRRDEYEYPIVMPLRLRQLLHTKDEVLERDELSSQQPRDPEFVEAVDEHKAYEGESLIKSLAMKRSTAVIQRKKVQEGWKTEGVRTLDVLAVLRFASWCVRCAFHMPVSPLPILPGGLRPQVPRHHTPVRSEVRERRGPSHGNEAHGRRLGHFHRATRVFVRWACRA